MGSPDYQSAFQRYLVGLPGEDGETRAYCPKHEEPGTSNPSASFNFSLGLWHCMGCNEGGDIAELHREMRRARANKRDFKTGIGKPKKEKSTSSSSKAASTLPSEEQVEQWHNRLIDNKQALLVMTDERGLNVETLKKFKIGWDGRRYTIPVSDADGVLANVRRYDPKAAHAQDKMRSIQGHGAARLFRPDLLAAYDEVIITEGEMDMMLAHQIGLPAITHTAGAGVFKAEWAHLFAGKNVYLCYDCDDAGMNGAIKAGRILSTHAKAVYNIDLNIDYKGGDVTDYFHKAGYGLDDFLALMDKARENPLHISNASHKVPDSGKHMSLEESMSTRKDEEDPIDVTVQISGKQSVPFLVPRKFTAKCNMDKGSVCTYCPMTAYNGYKETEILQDDPILMDFINVTNESRDKTLRKMVGSRCSDHVEYKTDERWSVEELVATNSVDDRDETDQTPIHRRLLNVGTYKTKVNSSVRIIGKQHVDPKSQLGLFHGWQLEPTQTNLDRFTMTPKIYKALQVFQCESGQTPLEKCDDIARDLSENVTKIYDRADLHIAYDLVWHSAMDFRFMGDQIRKGWLEALVIGDTRTGKSEAAIKLAHHYNAGVVKSCEGSTFAGIVGGAQQIAGVWIVTWGIVPLQDRRLVVLDEVSGLKDKDVIENMSSIRSSGRAQVTKIAAEETSARTRLIWISNPVDGQRLNANAGSAMYAIQRLVTHPEDISRFDFAMAVSGEEIDVSLINTSDTRHPVKHRYMPGKSETLVMWAWSRKMDQIKWADGAEKQIMTNATDMSARYVSEPPLVQMENIRMKLARIAVAMACRTFSTENGEDVIVTKDHANSAMEFLDRIYSTEAMGYARQSRRLISDRRKAEHRKDEVYAYLKKTPQALNGLFTIGDNTFRHRDFVDFAGMQDFEVQTLIQDLVDWRMVKRMSRGNMRMEPALVEILRQFEDEADMENLG